MAYTPIPFKFEKQGGEDDNAEGREGPKDARTAWKVPSPKRRGHQVEFQTEKGGEKTEANRFEALSDEEVGDEEDEEVTVVTTKEDKEERSGKEQQSYQNEGGKREFSKKNSPKKSRKTPKKSDTTIKEVIEQKEKVEKPQNQQRTDTSTVEEVKVQERGSKFVQERENWALRMDIRNYRAIQMARELTKEGEMSVETLNGLPEKVRYSVLVSMATNSILERTASLNPEDGGDSRMVFEYLSPLSDSSLCKIINDKEEYELTKSHAHEIELQRRTGDIGQTTDLFCMETLQDLMGKERISGTELENVIGDWLRRFFPRHHHKMSTILREKEWTGEDVKKIMLSEADHIWKRAKIPVGRAALRYYMEEELSKCTLPMEEQLTALIASPLNMEQDGLYSVRIVNAFYHTALSKKAKPGMARGIKAFSSGAVLAYGENDTLEQAIMNGLYIEEGGRSKPSPIHSVQEKRNTQSKCDVTLRSKDQSELKRIVAYLARALPMLTKRGNGLATLEYNRTLPIQTERREHHQFLCQYFGVERDKLFGNEKLRKMALNPLKLQQVLRELEDDESHRQRIHSRFVTSTTQELYHLMLQSPESIREIGRKFHPYKYGKGSAATKSNVETRFKLRIENLKSNEPAEAVAWAAMKALRNALETDGHKCQYPAFPKGELPESTEMDAIQSMCNPVLDDQGKWTSMDIVVQMSYMNTHWLQDRWKIGLSKPAEWLHWVFNSGTRVKWEEMSNTMGKSAMVLFTTELTLSNRDETVIEIEKIWRGTDDFTPPAFHIDYDRVSCGTTRANAIVIYTIPCHRVEIGRLVKNMERQEDQMTMGSNPSMVGTEIIPLQKTEGGVPPTLKEEIGKQQDYLDSVRRVSITGIEEKVNLDTLIPRFTGMLKSEDDEENKLSVRKLMLMGSVRTKDREEIPSPVARCGRTTDNRWTLEGQYPHETDLHKFVETMVERHLLDYMEGVANIRSLTLHSEFGPSLEEVETMGKEPMSRVAPKPEQLQMPPQPQLSQEIPQGDPPDFEDEEGRSDRNKTTFQVWGPRVEAIAKSVQQNERKMEENQRMILGKLQSIESTQSRHRNKMDGEMKIQQILEDVKQELVKLTSSLTDLHHQVCDVRTNQTEMEKRLNAALEMDVRDVEKAQIQRDTEQNQKVWKYIRQCEQNTTEMFTNSMKKMEQLLNDRHTTLEKNMATFNNSLYESLFCEVDGYETDEQPGHREDPGQEQTAGQDGKDQGKGVDEAFDEKLGVGMLLEGLDAAVKGVNEVDDKPGSSRGRDPTPSQGIGNETPQLPIRRLELVSGMSTDPSPKVDQLARKLQLAEHLATYTNPVESPQKEETTEQERKLTNETQATPEERGDLDDEESTILGNLDESETEETEVHTCNKCGEAFVQFHHKTRCTGCGKRYHVRCLAESSRSRCEECVETQGASSEEESEMESSSSSDTDDSYREENRMITPRPSQRRRGTMNRGREPEQLHCSSQAKGKKGNPATKAKQPPESLRNETTETTKLSKQPVQKEPPEQDE